MRQNYRFGLARILSTSFMLLALADSVIAQKSFECEPEPTNMEISYGDLITCDIDLVGDSDLFFFTGTAGDVLVLQVSTTMGFGNPCMRIFDPDVVLTASECEFNNPRLDLTLDQTGTYTILVSDDNDDETMSYTLALERHFPTADSGISICYGCLLEDQLGPVGDLDLFTFEGSFGDKVVLQSAVTSGFGNPCLEVFRPDGFLLSSQCEFNNPRLDLTLDKEGTYTVLVSDDNDDETMSYTLALERHYPIADSGVSICYGCLLEGQLSPVGDLDLFTFAGKSGDIIVLQSVVTGGFGNPCIEVFGPDGSPYSSQCEFNNPRLDLSLDQTGVYTVLLSDDNDDETMSYGIIVDVLVPLSCSAEHVCFGCTIGGDVDPIGDLDIFYFDGTDGDLVLLTLSTVSGFGNPCIELYSPDGLLVDSQCEFNNAMIDAVLDQDGIYTVLASDDNDDETFGYDLDVQCIGQCDSKAVACSEIFTDGFESGDTSEWSETVQ